MASRCGVSGVPVLDHTTTHPGYTTCLHAASGVHAAGYMPEIKLVIGLGIRALAHVTQLLRISGVSLALTDRIT